MPPRSKSKKSQKALERKERKLLEAKIKASKEKCEEGMVFIEPTGRNATPNYLKAIAFFDAAVAAYDGNADAFFYLGECYRGLEQFDKAIEYYTQCLGRDPVNVRALEGRAASNTALQKWQLVFEDYTTAIELEPNNDHIYNLRGLCTLSTRVPGLRLLTAEFNLCVSDFQKAIRLNEANYYAWANLGKAYEDQGLLEDALEAYSSALRTKEDYSHVQLRRGCLALRIVENSWEGRDDDYEKAKAAEKTARNGETDSKVLLKTKSIKEVEEEVRLEMKSASRRAHEEELLNTAIRDFQALMADDTKKLKWDPCLPLNLGTCFLLQNNLSKAEEEFRIVTEIINARPRLVADGEAEQISNLDMIEKVLSIKNEMLKTRRGQRFLVDKQQKKI